MKDINIEIIKDIARKAGEAILKIYSNEELFLIVDTKSDDSPLTLADKESNIVIEEGLLKYYPEIPYLSEEGKDVPFEERKQWERFWLVDPLDGTKEFIKRNDEFTVNIALIENGTPVLGVIYTPVTNEMYYGDKINGAFKDLDGIVTPLRTNDKANELIAVGSRSHASEEESDFLKKFGIKDKISKGSSLKFCLVAEGKADVYYRHGPTMEWDTAAGQAILESSGGIMLDEHKKPFRYNKEILRNGSFVCFANPAFKNL